LEEHDGRSALIKAATNEYSLLLYRAVTGGCALLMTWWIFDLKDETRKLRADFHAVRLENEIRVGKLEGAISVIDNAVRMQSRMIETNQNSVQSLWNRIYEMRKETR
jgi:hypothetical protein